MANDEKPKLISLIFRDLKKNTLERADGTIRLMFWNPRYYFVSELGLRKQITGIGLLGQSNLLLLGATATSMGSCNHSSLSLPVWSWRVGALYDSLGPLSQVCVMTVCEFLQVNPPARAQMNCPEQGRGSTHCFFIRNERVHHRKEHIISCLALVSETFSHSPPAGVVDP